MIAFDLAIAIIALVTGSLIVSLLIGWVFAERDLRSSSMRRHPTGRSRF